MDNTFFLKTKEGNMYLFDKTHNHLIVSHPIMQILYEEYKRNVNIEDLIQHENPGKICNALCEFSSEDILHYGNFFLLLLSQGFFAQSTPGLELELKEEDILRTLANSKQLTFEVTDACNLNCKYCGYGKFYGDYDARENKFIDLKASKNIIDYLVDLWNSELNQSQSKIVYINFYGGEPLMNMTFIKEVISYIKGKEIKYNKIHYSMTTNGLLLDKYMDFLVEHQFELLISIDGNKDNNGYRLFSNGGSSFDKLYKNIHELKNKYPDFFKKDNVQFNAVLHNKNSVADVYIFFQKEFGKSASISQLVKSGVLEEKKEEFYKTYRNTNESLHQAENYSEIEKTMFMNLPSPRALGEFLQQFSGNIFKSYNDLLFASNEYKGLPTGTCIPFDKKIFITVNGKIMVCERISFEYSCGKVTKNGVELNLKEIAKQYSDYYKKIAKQCINCYNIGYCSQCMFYLENLKGGPVCKGFTTKDKFINYLSGQISYIEDNPEFYNTLMEELFIE